MARYFSDRVLVMCGGRIVEEGNRSDIRMRPRTGYTRQLLDAVPTFDGAWSVGDVLTGDSSRQRAIEPDCSNEGWVR